MKFNAVENFDDLEQTVDTYLDVIDLGVGLQNGWQWNEDVQNVIKLATGLPATIAGIEDVPEALRTLTPEQHKLLEQKVVERRSFPDNDKAEENVDDITRGAIYFAKVMARAFGK